MKVLVNGGINLSELDGWWAEAYSGEVGWALGDGREHDDDPAWDEAEAEALYSLLEHEVIPQFYDRDGNGVPGAWVTRMRESMAQLTPRYSSARTVREYTERHYIPAAQQYLARAAEHGAAGQKIVAWQAALERHWNSLRFGTCKAETVAGQHRFEIALSLGGLSADAVRVELYAEALDGGAPERHRAASVRHFTDSVGSHVFTTAVPATRPPTDYTARVFPHFDGVSVPLEAPHILWQR
jgi:starch phosphorylase